MEDKDRGSTALEEAQAEDPIVTAIRRLNENLCDPGLSPSALAGGVGLELWQFCRRFKSMTGKTCIEFIAERRMREAMRLLARGDLLVKEIAYRTGFEDPNYFSRRFKRFVGTSPTSYRKGSARNSGEGGGEGDGTGSPLA